GFLLEAPDEVRASHERLVDHLERDVAPQPAIARAIDLGHASGTHDRDHLVGTELAARSQAHDAGDSSSEPPLTGGPLAGSVASATGGPWAPRQERGEGRHRSSGPGGRGYQRRPWRTGPRPPSRPATGAP